MERLCANTRDRNLFFGPGGPRRNRRDCSGGAQGENGSVKCQDFSITVLLMHRLFVLSVTPQPKCTENDKSQNRKNLICRHEQLDVFTPIEKLDAFTPILTAN